MGTVFVIFGFTVLGSKLVAVAEDLPKLTSENSASPTPSSPEPKPSNESINTLSGTAKTVFKLALTSGSFLVGAIYGFFVVYGILKGVSLLEK